MKRRSTANPNTQRPRRRHRPNPQDTRGAQQKYEHYLALARAADGNGAHVAAENYHQHAEHYLRSAASANVPAQPGL